MATILKSHFFKYGVPFFVFMIGGSFYLKEFVQVKHKYGKRTNIISEEELQNLNKQKKEEVTLESEYEKIKKLDIDNWENKRIPRPWEE